MPSIEQIQQAVQLLAMLVLAFYGVTKAGAALFGFLGAFWPGAMKVAAALNSASDELHMLGAKLGSLFPMSAAKMAAKRAAKAVPPALVLLVALMLGATQLGCGSLFAKLATTNPVVDATAFEEAAGVADRVAEEAFAIALPLLPAANQAPAQAAMSKAQASYGDAIAALNDAVRGYQDGTSQNWSGLYADVESAVDALVSAVDVWGSPAAGGARVMLVAPAFATAQANLTRAVITVHRYH